MAADAVLQKWKDHRTTMLVMPTGCGKTIVFSEIIRRSLPLRTMIIAHREELIWQACGVVEKMTGVKCGVEMGDLSAAYAQRDLFGGDNPPVVVATVQTLNSRAGDRKRMGRFNPAHFHHLIIDECHHATSDTYQSVTNYLCQNPHLRVLGVTATPDRLDRKAMGEVFESVAFTYEVLDAIHDGWLVRPDQAMVNIIGLDFSHIRTTAGDLNGGDLAQVMEAQSNLLGVADAVAKLRDLKKTLVFTASVAQAETLSEIFKERYHLPGEWVCGTTPKDKRRDIVSRFADGQLQIVCNCDCFTEGFDDPGVQLIVMAKPTKSRAKYSQMIGRAMRPLTDTFVDQYENAALRRTAISRSSKPCCEILDFVGNCGRHKLVTVVDILGGDYSEPLRKKVKDIIVKRGGAISVEDAVNEVEAIERAQREQTRARELARRAKVTANASFTKKMVSPFDVLDLQPPQEHHWKSGKVLSQAQEQLLRQNGIDPHKVGYNEGKALLDEMFRRWGKNLASYKQCKLLKRYGVETRDLTKEAATRLIVEFKNNGWKRGKYGTTQSIRSSQVHGGRPDLPLRAEARRGVGQATPPPVHLAGSSGADPSDDPEANGIFHQ